MTDIQLRQMARRIKARRESLGFTQESFCEAIDLSASSYTKIENAFQKPSLDTLIRIAGRLGLSLDYIVFGSEERKSREALDADVLGVLLESTDSASLLHASAFLAKIAKIKGK